jgi:hypothetical protein
MILFHERWAINGARGVNDPRRFFKLAADSYEVVRIPNPYGYHGYWLVVLGTKIGGPEEWWHQWVPTNSIKMQPKSYNEAFEVIIKNTP